MKSALLRVAILAAGAVLATTVSVANGITQVSGGFACPGINNQQECAIKVEKRFLAAHPRIVRRSPSALTFRLLDGRRFTIGDTYQVYNAVEISPDGRFIAVREQWSEGNTWHILDRVSGKLTAIEGYPLFSPNQRLFVAASEDLDAGYSATVFDVYEVPQEGIALVHRAIPDPNTPFLGRRVT